MIDTSEVSDSLTNVLDLNFEAFDVMSAEVDGLQLSSKLSFLFASKFERIFEEGAEDDRLFEGGMILSWGGRTVANEDEEGLADDVKSISGRGEDVASGASGGEESGWGEEVFAGDWRIRSVVFFLMLLLQEGANWIFIVDLGAVEEDDAGTIDENNVVAETSKRAMSALTAAGHILAGAVLFLVQGSVDGAEDMVELAWVELEWGSNRGALFIYTIFPRVERETCEDSGERLVEVVVNTVRGNR